MPAKETAGLVDTEYRYGGLSDPMVAAKMKVLVLILLLAGGAARAAEVRGMITGRPARPQPPPRYVEREVARESDAPQAAMIAVVVEELDGPHQTPSPVVPDTPLVMAQEGVAFVPNLLVVPAGGRVTFPNHDPVFHNVFSYSSAKSFDLGRFPKGQTRTVQFDRPGIVRVFCEIHASMFATIMVVDSERYLLVRSGDSFAFDGLPPGRYRLVATDVAGRLATIEFSLSAQEVRHVDLTLGR